MDAKAAFRGTADIAFQARHDRTAADVSQHFIFRSRSLFQPYQSARPSGYYDASLGGGHERATFSLRSGWCGGVTAYGGGSAAAAQDHRLPRRRRGGRVDSDGRYPSARTPMVATRHLFCSPRIQPPVLQGDGRIRKTNSPPRCRDVDAFYGGRHLCSPSSILAWGVQGCGGVGLSNRYRSGRPFWPLRPPSRALTRLRRRMPL